ncbi:hemicentin-1-like, partial [Mixophyes fleayi]|uniref:hemicentin-1-like n=1 Tax=Mixophyes fleayi TaxID=3061075 RepID=UPI003F4DC0E2
MDIRYDLRIWSTFLKDFNGVRIWQSPIVSSLELELHTDASGAHGFGAFFKGEWCASPWPIEWRQNGLVKNLLNKYESSLTSNYNKKIYNKTTIGVIVTHPVPLRILLYPKITEKHYSQSIKLPVPDDLRTPIKIQREEHRTLHFFPPEYGSAPVFTENPSNIAMDIGSDVILHCTAQGFPEPKIKWRKLNATSTFSKPLMYNQKTGTLQISNLWVGDEGTYLCEAENQFGKVQSQVIVTLTGLVIPAIGESPSMVSVIEGNQITLPCVILAGNPLPVRQWFKDNIVLVSNPYVSVRTDGSLHLESVHLKDGGEYVCAVTNVAGTSRRATTVNVYVSPIIQHGPQIFSTIEGHAVSLPCKASGVPKPSIIWKK